MAQTLKLADNRVMASRVDRIWAAGLFEGEGTITIARRGQDDTYRLVCTVGNTDLQIINFFHQRWGGWHQPAYGERPGRKKAWTWTVAGPAAESFLRAVEPFIVTLRVRRKLRLAVDFRSGQSRLTRVSQAPGYKDAQRMAYAEMKRLNKRGVAA